jgi:hypothetical protein
VAESDEELDRQHFFAKIDGCLNDRRIATYFERDLAGRTAVRDHPTWPTAFSRAKRLESYQKYYQARTQSRQLDAAFERLFDENTINGRTGLIVLLTIVSILVLVSELFQSDGLLAILSLLLSGGALFLGMRHLHDAINERRGKRAKAIVISGLLTACGPLFLGAAFLYLNVEWRPWKTLIILSLACLSGYSLRKPEAMAQAVKAFSIFAVVGRQIGADAKVDSARQEWLASLGYKVIIPHATYIINSQLGNDYQKFLVEQDSAGLRKLYDPQLTIPTDAVDSIESAIRRLDGGSIAIAGPRGAGKSTLLRTLSLSQNDMLVHINAPAEYMPKEFLGDLLNRYCRTYLDLNGWSAGPTLEPNFATKKRAFRIFRDTTAATIRSLLAIGLAVFILWSLVADWSVVVNTINTTSTVWSRQIVEQVQIWWREYPTLFKVALGILVFFLWPGKHKWRSLKWNTEPELVLQARRILYRLQIDRTITRGSTAGLSAPFGISAGLNAGSSLKHIPWSLPELVHSIRGFIEATAAEIRQSDGKILICIDEIDRIGSIEKAERFISEIKAIFGIENCYFLVSVAEDVGSIFGRRALASKSVFETAFDEVILIEPLTLEESRDLLLRRVLGVADPFVYLIHSVSGGVPREILRSTRRLVELNERLREVEDRAPKLENLATALILEELVEVLKGARDYLSRSLSLNETNGFALDLMRISIRSIRAESSFIAPRRALEIIEPLVSLSILAGHETGQPMPEPSGEALEASMTFSRVAVFSYFALTVVQVFSDDHFDIGMAHAESRANSLLSFEELAAVRREVGLAHESSLVALERFRQKWGLLSL